MAAHSFSSLTDMLNQPPSHNSNLMVSLSSHPMPKTKDPHEHPHVTEIFGELYFKESSSSTLQFLFPPPPPTSSPSSLHDLQTDNIGKPNDEPNLEKKKNNGKHIIAKKGCIYDKRLMGNKEKLFPPPISCLISTKSGNPFVYFRIDENSSTYVCEEMRILPRGILCASRQSGCLKLSFGHEEEDVEEEEDGEEAIDERETIDEEECPSPRFMSLGV